MSQPVAPDPKRKTPPRRESIEKPPPRPERRQERGGPDTEPTRSPPPDFDPNVNSTRT